MLGSIWRQSVKRIPLLLLLLIPVLLITGFVILISWKTGQPIYVLFQDIFFVAQVPLYIGFVSNVGAFVWAFAIAICGYIGFLLYGKREQREIAFFFLYASFLGLLLMLDDYFMLHEIIYPRYFHIESEIIYLIYAALGITFVIKFKKIILQSDMIILFFAFSFFALSIFFDEVRESMTMSDYWIIAEDGSKLIGIIYWLTYFSITGKKYLKSTEINSQT
ncbi:MAG: hypothetical protein HZB59_04940 [Ignavibacteriales bacterium]|nr:hypothetical protein [Ignavibacteriales bacterium]